MASWTRCLNCADCPGALPAKVLRTPCQQLILELLVGRPGAQPDAQHGIEKFDFLDGLALRLVFDRDHRPGAGNSVNREAFTRHHLFEGSKA